MKSNENTHLGNEVQIDVRHINHESGRAVVASNRSNQKKGGEPMYEPWVHKLTKWDFVIGETETEVKPEVPSGMVTVLDRDGNVIGERKVYGVLAYADKPFLVRFEYKRDLPTKGFLKWAETVGADLDKLERKLKGGYNITPVNSSWHKRTRDGKVAVYVLLTKEYTNREAKKSVGRLGAFLGKLTAQSYVLKEGAIIDGGDPERSYYRDWDSVYFLKESALTATPTSRVVQMLGIRHPETFIKEASKEPSPVLWGTALVVPDKHWNVVLEGCGIPGSPADVVASNRDYIKFIGNTPLPLGEYTLYCAKEAFVTKKATLVQEDRQLHQMYDDAIEMIRALREKGAEEIFHAFTELANGNRSSLIEMCAAHLKELYESAKSNVEGDVEMDAEDVEVLFQKLQGTVNALLAGAPVRGEKLQELFESLIHNKVRSLRVPGVTAFSFPTSLTEWGIYLPAECKRDVEIGQKVTDIRLPNSGTSMIPVTVEGFTPLPVVIASPKVGKFYQNEDYDGDVSIVVYENLIKREGWLDPVQKVPELGDLDPKMQIIYGSFSKHAIGLADYQVTARVIKGVDTTALDEERYALQCVVDMAKKMVDTSRVENEFGNVELDEKAAAGRIVRTKASGNTLMNLIALARTNKPTRVIYSGASRLPIVDFSKCKRELDPAKIDRERVFDMLSTLLTVPGALERAKWLLHAYAAYYNRLKSEETQSEGYALLREAKVLIMSDTEKWAPALKLLACMSAALVVDRARFFQVINKYPGKKIVAFDKDSVYAVYDAAFKKGGKLYDNVPYVYIPRSFGIVTTFPTIVGSYVLEDILHEIGHDCRYDITVS